MAARGAFVVNRENADRFRAFFAVFSNCRQQRAGPIARSLNRRFHQEISGDAEDWLRDSGGNDWFPASLRSRVSLAGRVFVLEFGGVSPVWRVPKFVGKMCLFELWFLIAGNAV